MYEWQFKKKNNNEQTSFSKTVHNLRETISRENKNDQQKLTVVVHVWKTEGASGTRKAQVNLKPSGTNE